MKSMKLKLVAGAALAAVIGASGVAAATQVPTTMTVSATAIASCTIASPTTMAFGNVNPIAAGSVTANATVAVTCTNTTPYLLAVTGGTLPSGGFVYTISSTSGTYTAFPALNGTPDRAGIGSTQTITMYGKIALPQGTVVPATYSDTAVAVTVEY